MVHESLSRFMVSQILVLFWHFHGSIFLPSQRAPRTNKKKETRAGKQQQGEKKLCQHYGEKSERCFFGLFLFLLLFLLYLARAPKFCAVSGCCQEKQVKKRVDGQLWFYHWTWRNLRATTLERREMKVQPMRVRGFHILTRQEESILMFDTHI